MTTLKKLFVLWLVFVPFALLGQVPSWQPQIDECIAHGDFARAEKIMDKLPRKVRKADAVRIDSLKTIMQRIRKDFTMTPEEGLSLIRERVPNVTAEQLARWKANRQLEVMTIDGKEWWFRKSVRNLWLLAPEFEAEQQQSSDESFAIRRKYYLHPRRCQRRARLAPHQRDLQTRCGCRRRARWRDSACVDAHPL